MNEKRLEILYQHLLEEAEYGGYVYFPMYTYEHASPKYTAKMIETLINRGLILRHPDWDGHRCEYYIVNTKELK